MSQDQVLLQVDEGCQNPGLEVTSTGRTEQGAVPGLDKGALLPLGHRSGLSWVFEEVEIRESQLKG